jgi:hypothetical protein
MELSLWAAAGRTLARLVDLKATLDDLRAQRDNWQTSWRSRISGQRNGPRNPSSRGGRASPASGRNYPAAQLARRRDRGMPPRARLALAACPAIIAGRPIFAQAAVALLWPTHALCNRGVS